MLTFRCQRSRCAFNFLFYIILVLKSILYTLSAPSLCCCAVQVTRRLVSQSRDTTMASVSYQTHTRFTFLSDTFRTVRIVFRTVPFNDTVKKAITKTKTGFSGLEESSPDTSVCCFQAGRATEAISEEAEGGKPDDQTNRSRALAAEGARSWRPEFDLGWACLGLPLNAGRDTQRAACGTWSRLMRKRKHSSWQKCHSSLLPPHSIFLWIPLCLFPNIQQIPALGLVREHSSQRLLSFFAPFQNFNLISLSVFMSLSVVQERGPLKCCFLHSFNSETKTPSAPASARPRPQTPTLLAAARDSSVSEKRPHSWVAPQSPSNSRRCFGV